MGAPEMSNVDHPSHYNTGTMEVMDAIDGLGLGFLEGNILKYVARFRHKNGVEDLRKALWYLNRLIENESGVESVCQRQKTSASK